MDKNLLDTTIARFITPENIRTYILGTKKNGEPRALYDIMRDVFSNKSKRKKKKKKDDFSILIKKKGKKKKGKKKDKEWKFK